MKYNRVEPTGEMISVPIIYQGQRLNITARAHSLAEAEAIVMRAYTGATVRRWDQMDMFSPADPQDHQQSGCNRPSSISNLDDQASSRDPLAAVSLPA